MMKNERWGIFPLVAMVDIRSEGQNILFIYYTVYIRSNYLHVNSQVDRDSIKN